MAINLKNCNGICKDCIKNYSNKFRLKRGDKFEIACTGIPEKYIPDELLSSLGEDSNKAVALMDPVTWAREYLDWHCLDPDGIIWRKKSEEGSTGSTERFQPDNPDHIQRLKNGKSPYHRPYQFAMLSCTAKRKIFRIGRRAGKSESLCVSILYNVFTRNNFEVLLLTPYQAQIDAMFKRLEELMQNSSILLGSVARNVKSPNYKIEFKNGSIVKGFTAGSRSGQGAGSARGQGANFLAFDETDFLNPADIDAALAVIISHPDASVWMSSTPSGRREQFYKSCFSPEYKEFHFSSSHSPTWNEGFEKYFRTNLTEDGYKHEIGAEFGDQEEGVYQIKYVESAQDEYEYADKKYDPSMVYMIGVDWNDVKIGTTIAVIGFNPVTGYFYLVDKHIVTRNERTQLTACDKIAEMNRLWLPSYIYVDAGYGCVQVEVLHDFGQQQFLKLGAQHPDARLRNIVKAYDFGSSIEVRDIFTQQPSKKPAKPFLVENSVRRFENLNFKYPKSDTNFTEQLLGYVVKRVSQTGRPIYEARNELVGDHFLDAVNLALVAFTLEKSKFGKPTYPMASISFVGKMGEGDKTPEKNTQDSMGKLADSHRPSMNRKDFAGKTKSLIGSPHGDIPGSNMANPNNKLWNYPGFLRDAPRPNVRTLDEAMKEAGKRINFGISRRTRPNRVKF